MNSVSRRDFVKVLAVFGSAMALPESLRGQALPPPQEAIILPADALSVSSKQFLWVDRIPLTEGYQFDLRYSQPVDWLFRPNSPYDTVPSIVQQPRLSITITTAAHTFSRLFAIAVGSSPVELAFMLPGDFHANVVQAYCENLSESFSLVDAHVVTTEFQAIEEPRQIPAAQMPKYLSGKT